jgi:hypothetical protein
MKTFPLVFILLISLVVLSCTQGGGQTQAPKDSLGIVLPTMPLSDTGWTNPKSDTPLTTIKTNSMPPPPHKQDTLKYFHYEGLKSFDERYRYEADTFFRNMKGKIRINDSLIAAKRRELQIEDSLKRLK